MIKVVRPSLPTLEVDEIRAPGLFKPIVSRKTSHETMHETTHTRNTSSSDAENHSPVSSNSLNSNDAKKGTTRRQLLKRRSSSQRSLSTSASKEDLAASTRNHIKLLTTAVTLQNDTIKKIEVELRTQRQLFIQGIYSDIYRSDKRNNSNYRNARAAQNNEATEELGSYSNYSCLFIPSNTIQ